MRIAATGLARFGSNGGGSSVINVVSGSHVNFSPMSLAPSAAQQGFKGRRLYRLAAGAQNLPWFQPGYFGWRVDGLNGAGSSEVVLGNAMQVIKAAMLVRDGATLALKGNSVPITKDGERSFTFAGSTAGLHVVDPVMRSSFGTTINTSDFLEWRWYFHLDVGQQAYRMPATYASQGWRFDEANLVDDIDGTGVMGIGSGNAGQYIAFPNVILGPRRSFGGKSWALCGDSIGRNQNSIDNTIDAAAGANYLTIAASKAGHAGLNTSVGGRASSGLINSPLTRAAIKAYTDRHVLAFGTNDIAFATTASQLEANLRALSAEFRAAGHVEGIASNVWPRVTEGATNTTNLHAGSDLSVMVPYITQAVSPSAGYGFGSGETRDIWNGTNLPALVSEGLFKGICDVATIGGDPTTPWKWKVPAYASTLAAATIAGQHTLSLNHSPPLKVDLVVEPGVSNREPEPTVQGGPQPFSVSGAGPYTANCNYTLAYNGGTNGIGAFQVTKVHASGSTVKASYCPDYTHPGTALHALAADALATLMAA